ncbi:MAG: hypothetical protein PXZ08_00620, partial [Actinomycetota bacterium]|nr:hypothetical protein [Actinomycetota bacterium]
MTTRQRRTLAAVGTGLLVGVLSLSSVAMARTAPHAQRSAPSSLGVGTVLRVTPVPLSPSPVKVTQLSKAPTWRRPVVVAATSGRVVVRAGATVNFRVRAKGNPTPRVQWYVAVKGSHFFNQLRGAVDTTLTLRRVATRQNGVRYEAVFTNRAGSVVTHPITLIVRPVAKIPVTTVTKAPVT